MPTYEYECERCGHRFERFQSITEKPVKRCPECRGKVKRVLSGGAGFLFKGSGFYCTDYRSSEYRKRAKEETGGSSKEDPGAGKGASSKEPGKKAEKERPAKSPASE
ncbi:MAG: zinc ribbon domain-containing protein [Candidatus Eisenbacteria bacterium]|nr:zinc ribbon domain-containing protein [Candidatus Eisenbacteria bacterium]